MELITICLLCYSSVLTITSVCSYYFISHASEHLYNELERNLKTN